MKAMYFGMILQTLKSSQLTDSSTGNDFILLPKPMLPEVTDTCPVTLVLCAHKKNIGRT